MIFELFDELEDFTAVSRANRNRVGWHHGQLRAGAAGAEGTIFDVVAVALQRGHLLAGLGVPESEGFIFARRDDPATIWTEGAGGDGENVCYASCRIGFG